MVKKIKKIEKWLLLVLISFCVVFTIINIDGKGLGKGLIVRLKEDNFNNMNVEELEKVAKMYEEDTQRIMNTQDNYAKVFEKYPTGTYRILKGYVELKIHSDNLIVSLIFGVLIGTVIFLIIDEERKGIKLLILFYISSILLLGFLEGIENVSNSILDAWEFPVTYIIPATLMYAILLVCIKIKQQNLAIELNRKLQEEKKREDNLEAKEETFLERTREKREKIAKVMSVAIEMIMILIVFIYLICT